MMLASLGKLIQDQNLNRFNIYKLVFTTYIYLLRRYRSLSPEYSIVGDTPKAYIFSMKEPIVKRSIYVIPYYYDL